MQRSKLCLGLDVQKEIQSLNWENYVGVCTYNAPYRRTSCIQDMNCFVIIDIRKIRIYSLILNSFGQRSQYISIKVPLHKQSENP